MTFVFEMEYSASADYIPDFARALAIEEGVDISLLCDAGKLTIAGEEDDPKLPLYLEKLGAMLPASVFMGNSSYRFTDETATGIGTMQEIDLPHSIALCTQCMKEIFDPQSRRYYYPFTSCNCCGAHYPFFEKYPFARENTLMRFFVSCESCKKELQDNPFRKSYPLISCHECGVPVRLKDPLKELYANDAESFKRMFEITAKAICSGKSVRIKTLFGERLFYDAQKVCRSAEKIMMIVDPSILKSFALAKDEIHALLSIERPVIYAKLKDETLYESYGSIAGLKYPDEGFTILLAKELGKLGCEHIAYEVCDEKTWADFIMDFDLPIEPQRECRLFNGKSVRFFTEAERVAFPMRFKHGSNRVVIAHGMAAVPGVGGVTIDRVEKFDTAEVEEVYVLKGETSCVEHSNIITFSQEKASVLSVLLEHERERESAVGIYFCEEPIFIYHNGRTTITAVSPVKFEQDRFKEKMLALREGSDRLVKNFESKFTNSTGKLFGREGVEDIFTASALIMDIPGYSFESVMDEASKFSGKGGLRIDTKNDRGSFDPYIFLASLMSYRLAGAGNELLAYSIFESLGDYIGEISRELKNRTKAEHIVLCGRVFSAPSLIERVYKNLGKESCLMNIALPIDKENALLGALGL